MKRYLTPPNQLTFLRILMIPVFVGMLFSESVETRHWSVVVYIVASLTDWYDGWVARRWGFVTRFGKFFDPLADKIATSAALIAFIYLDLVPAWTVWIIIGRDVIITFLRTYAEYKGKPFETTRFAKTKTLLQFVGIYYILILHVAQGSPYIPSGYGQIIDLLLDWRIVHTMMIVIAGVTLASGLMYLRDNRKTLSELYDFTNRVTES